MPSFTIRQYDNYGKYELRIVGITSNRSISVGDLRAHAETLGAANGSSPSKEAKAFYRSIVDMALDGKGPSFEKSADYVNAEVSFKGAISFFVGMLMSKVIAADCHNVSHMLHLQAPDLHPVYVLRASGAGSNGEEHPDFLSVGGDDGDLGLYEAKGTSGGVRDKAGVEKAVRQVSNVREVELCGACLPLLAGIKTRQGSFGGRIASVSYGRIAATSFPRGCLTVDDVLRRFSSGGRPQGPGQGGNGGGGSGSGAGDGGRSNDPDGSKPNRPSAVVDLNAAAYATYRNSFTPFEQALQDKVRGKGSDNPIIRGDGYWWIAGERSAIGLDERIASQLMVMWLYRSENKKQVREWRDSDEVVEYLDSLYAPASFEDGIGPSAFRGRLEPIKEGSDYGYADARDVVRGKATILALEAEACKPLVEEIAKRSGDEANELASLIVSAQGILKAGDMDVSGIGISRVDETSDDLQTWLSSGKTTVGGGYDNVLALSEARGEALKIGQWKRQIAKTYDEIRRAYDRYNLYGFFSSSLSFEENWFNVDEAVFREGLIARVLGERSQADAKSLHVWAPGDGVVMVAG